MKYFSVCSGIGTCRLASPTHWECAGFSEIDSFARALLLYRFPEIPLYDDFTKIDTDAIGTVDALVGGTPCQSFSFAGQRAGISDPRGELSLEFVNLARRLQTRWVVWENVPGVLSSGRGLDFAKFIRALTDSGYCVSWRVLDSQWFGVPQQRRRVYVVGHFGADERIPASVLFEPEVGRWPTSSRRRAAEVAADEARRGAEETLVIATANYGGNQSGYAWNTSYTVDPSNGQAVAAYDIQYIMSPHDRVTYSPNAATSTLTARSEMIVTQPEIIRHLTPRECERLQGLPDDWTLIPWKGKPAPNTRRYKAIGNGWAVPVVRWILSRMT